MLANRKGVPHSALHGAMKTALGVQSIKGLSPEEISDQAWEMEVAAAELEEPDL